MRITRQTLLKIAKDKVTQVARENRGLLAAYLTGSMVREIDPVFGGTADIDLVFIHDGEPPLAWEVVRLTEAVHLDIYHHERGRYRHPRSLREHPRLGSALYGCQILHDPRHFLDFAQASVRAHFFRPDYVIKRARGLIHLARETWFSFQFYDSQPGREEVKTYLDALCNAANAVACLNGFPLSGRRFLLEFSARTNTIGKPGLYAGLLGLMGAATVSGEEIRAWIPLWEKAYQAVRIDAPIDLHPHKLPYYRKAIDAFLESPAPLNALWPLLSTWLRAAERLPEGQEDFQNWQRAFTRLGLMGDEFKRRISGLDVYLDMAEETIEQWGNERGVG